MLKDNIKRIRENNHISQRELARRINMSSQMISKIERGETTPSLETLNKIAEALDIKVDELLNTGKIIYSDAIKEIQDFIETYPENETAIAKTVKYFSECLFYIYVKKGNNSPELATKNITLFNELLSKIRVFLMQDIVTEPNEKPIKYAERSLDNIGKISEILTKIYLNKLAMYTDKEDNDHINDNPNTIEHEE